MAPASAEVAAPLVGEGEAVAVAPAEVVAPAAAVEHPAEVAVTVVAHPAEVPAVVARAAGLEHHRTADPADLHAHRLQASDCHVAASTQRPQ